MEAAGACGPAVSLLIRQSQHAVSSESIQKRTVGICRNQLEDLVASLAFQAIGKNNWQANSERGNIRPIQRIGFLTMRYQANQSSPRWTPPYRFAKMPRPGSANQSCHSVSLIDTQLHFSAPACVLPIFPMEFHVPDSFVLECLAKNAASRPLQIEKAILSIVGNLSVTSTDALDLREYERLGHCEVRLRPVPRPETVWHWGGEDHDRLFPQHQQAVWDVTWRDHQLAVFDIAWSTSCGEEHRYWVVAEQETIARDFMLDVARKTNDPGEAILVFRQGHWQRSAGLYLATRQATFDDLVLAGDLKQQLRDDFRRFISARSRYEELGLAWRRGAMFIGPPGNGKTHCIRALVRELNIPSLYVQSLSHPQMPGEYLLGQIFHRARQLRPCILIFEDLDALIKPANRSFFLNQMDGFEKNVGLIVIATTNHPERIDPAILDRPSRFDRKYSFELPAARERMDYLIHWQGKLASQTGWTDTGIAATVSETEGFSFAYLKELVVSALLEWTSSEHLPFETLLAKQVRELRSQMATGRNIGENRVIDNTDNE
jgi:ATPase family associated with various cellular activities (AAA)